MNTRTVNRTPQKSIKIDCVVPKFSSNKDMVERKLKIDTHISTGSLTEVLFENMRIFSVSHQIKRKGTFRPENIFPHVQMSFVLSGECSTKSYRSNETYRYSSNQHNLVYLPHSEIDYTIESSSMSLMGVQFTEKFFFDLCDGNPGALSGLLRHIEKGEEAKLMPAINMTITPKMQSILSEIKNADSKGYLKRLFLETKAIELFIAQLEQAENLNKPLPSCLNKKDIEKLYAVKEFIEQNILQNHSLASLSRKVGLNEFKLKKGFKELFGTTVFSYLNSLRMHYAKELILEGKKLVAETAVILGYSESHHFATAFKKYFGYSPGQLKS